MTLLYMIRQLSVNDIDAIMDLERSTWDPWLQASKDTIIKRLESGHIMLGYTSRSRLNGLISSSYGYFDPEDYEKFPKTFREFSNRPRLDKYNAAFGYNLAVRPGIRGSPITRNLIMAGIARALSDNCRYIVGDGRCPSYNGSNGKRTYQQSKEFKNAIDMFTDNLVFPKKKEFLYDPTLALYHRVLKCEFLWIMPGFIPEDTSSGGFRIIFYKDLKIN